MKFSEMNRSKSSLIKKDISTVKYLSFSKGNIMDLSYKTINPNAYRKKKKQLKNWKPHVFTRTVLKMKQFFSTLQVCIKKMQMEW